MTGVSRQEKKTPHVGVLHQAGAKAGGQFRRALFCTAPNEQGKACERDMAWRQGSSGRLAPHAGHWGQRTLVVNLKAADQEVPVEERLDQHGHLCGGNGR